MSRLEAVNDRFRGLGIIGRANRERRISNQLSQFGWRRRMTQMGHEDQFRPLSLSGGCRLGKETFAGTRGNGQDAPEAGIFEPQNLRQSAVAFQVGD
jgi:hypothetical protein